MTFAEGGANGSNARALKQQHGQFRTNGEYMPGMSGGPVFDERGCVVGVVSHGMLPEDGTEPVGYAASIGGVAELKLDLELDDGSTRELTMPQLAEEIASP